MKSKSLRQSLFVPCMVLAVSPAAMADTTLQIADPQPGYMVNYTWGDGSLWDNGTPQNGDSVFMPMQQDNGNPVDVRINAYNENITIANFDIDYGVTLDVFDGTFRVLGSTDAEGFISITRGTMSLGQNVLYNGATRTLEGGQCLVSDGGSSTQTIFEWEGADIVVNRGGFNLFGANVVVRDQNSGLNAFRNLAVNHHFLTIDDGYVMNISGNFENSQFGEITMNLNESSRAPKFEISGNFLNDGVVSLRGNTVFNVSGGLSGSGRIVVTGSGNQVSVVGVYTQNGGEVNLGNGNAGGGSGIDSFTLKAQAHIYDGGSVVKGSGTLEGGVTITSGTMSPGSSPGEITVDGDLTLEDGSLLDLEIGGDTAVTGFDRVRQINGESGITLGGELKVNIIGDFYDTIQAEDEFAVITSDHALQGEFLNVTSGDRLVTADGRGSFLVTYTGQDVVLSGFEVIPESFSSWLSRYQIPSGQEGALDDPNEDGITNLEAYVRGIPPVGPTAAKPPQTVINNGNLSVSLSTSRSLEGVLVKSQVSSDLVLWTDGPQASATDESATRNLLQLTVPQTPTEPKFIRFAFEEENP